MVVGSFSEVTIDSPNLLGVQRLARRSSAWMSAYTGSCFFRGAIMDFLMKLFLPVLLILSSAQAAEIKPVPPPGVAVPAADRAELEAGLARLGHSIDKIRNHPLAPDVIIFHTAVRYALQYDEFFKTEEIAR